MAIKIVAGTAAIAAGKNRGIGNKS